MRSATPHTPVCLLDASASRNYVGHSRVSTGAKEKHQRAGHSAQLMQRVGGGFRELPPSMYEQLEQAKTAVDELRRQLAAQQAATTERDRSLEKRRAEVAALTEAVSRLLSKEGQSAQSLVKAQMELADKAAHWNEMLTARNDALAAQEGAHVAAQQEALSLRDALAASQRDLAEARQQLDERDAKVTALSERLAVATDEASAARGEAAERHAAAVRDHEARRVAAEEELQRRVSYAARRGSNIPSSRLDLPCHSRAVCVPTTPALANQAALRGATRGARGEAGGGGARVGDVGAAFA